MARKVKYTGSISRDVDGEYSWRLYADRKSVDSGWTCSKITARFALIAAATEHGLPFNAAQLLADGYRVTGPARRVS